jgi:hypothetical protein
MSSQFDKVPVEPDTRILMQVEAKLDDYEALYQKWSWDGITAESFIFPTAAVMSLTDEALKSLAASSPMVKPDAAMTLSRQDQFCFVNFNFVSE